MALQRRGLPCRDAFGSVGDVSLAISRVSAAPEQARRHGQQAAARAAAAKLAAEAEEAA